MKTIKHPLYGGIQCEDFLIDLISTPEVQRLRFLPQLGLCDVIYPGATHTRFTHAIGVSHTARRMAEKLCLSESERKLVQAAGLLHDIGHYPCSHTFEIVVHRLAPQFTHERISGWLITGKHSLQLPGAGRLPEILRKHGIDPEAVAALVTSSFKGPAYLQDIISGAIDADRLDYLNEDAYFTGVKAGTIDVERILDVLVIHDGRLAISEKGAPAAHAMQAARDYMTAEVYLHHTLRVCRVMLSKAVTLCTPLCEEISLAGTEKELPKFFAMGDVELFAMLSSHGGRAADLVNRIRYQRDSLYKIAFQIKGDDPARGKISSVAPEAVEAALCNISGLPVGSIIVDKMSVAKPHDDEHLAHKGVRIAPSIGKASNYAYLIVCCEKNDVARVRDAAERYFAAANP